MRLLAKDLCFMCCVTCGNVLCKAALMLNVDAAGTSGQPINLVSNLFKLEHAPNFHLFQYRVDFNPEVPSKGMRKAMLKEHVDLIGRDYQFDGMALFLPIRLEREVLHHLHHRKDSKTIDA